MSSTRRCTASAAGYSIVEMMFILGIMGVLSAMAVVQIGSVRPGFAGDGAMRTVVGQMQRAREQAIAQRRYMRVTFTQPNGVFVYREDTTTTTTKLSTGVFEGGVKFGPVSGLPDTTDGFGYSATTGINFGSVTNIKFAPDGTLVNQDGATLNGSVFLAVPGQKLSARAVTIQGSTGRIRAWKWDGKAWKMV